MAEIDVFAVPADWQFYHAILDYQSGRIEVAGEPHGSCRVPTITLHIVNKKGSATLYLNADDASEVWTALGMAIANAGKPPEAKTLIAD